MNGRSHARGGSGRSTHRSCHRKQPRASGGIVPWRRRHVGRGEVSVRTQRKILGLIVPVCREPAWPNSHADVPLPVYREDTIRSPCIPAPQLAGRLIPGYRIPQPARGFGGSAGTTAIPVYRRFLLPVSRDVPHRARCARLVPVVTRPSPCIPAYRDYRGVAVLTFPLAASRASRFN